jgi:hypothetical protein
MPSPFPGMNPFLEQSDAWEDFHLNYISRLQEALCAVVSDDYIVKVETRIYVHELSEDERKSTAKADVSVSGGPSQSATRATAIIAGPPIRILYPTVDTERYTWIEIRDKRDRHVVTAIELLSPTNKTPGPDRDDYIQKRSMYFFSNAHFIEIDLRRGGTRPSPPILPACDYYVLLSHVQDRFNFGVWPLKLGDRLPLIPVPLKAPDPDVPLDLQAVLDRVYDSAHYGNYIYKDTPEPPLSVEQVAWAKQFVPESSAAESKS